MNVPLPFGKPSTIQGKSSKVNAKPFWIRTCKHRYARMAERVGRGANETNIDGLPIMRFVEWRDDTPWQSYANISMVANCLTYIILRYRVNRFGGRTTFTLTI